MKNMFWANVALALAVAVPFAHADKKKPVKESAADERAEANVHITKGPEVTHITGNSAIVTWTTDNVGANNLQYRPTSGGEWKKGFVKKGSKDHWIELHNLNPNTDYEYQILTTDGDVRTTGHFKTAASGSSAGSGGGGNGSQKAQSVKIIDGPRVEGVGETWATIAWTTNTGGSSTLHYGTSAGALNETAHGGYKGAGNPVNQKETHRVTVKGLKPGTTYFFVADSSQGEGTGTEAKSSVSQFTTKNKGK
jgi:hypothetical protein